MQKIFSIASTWKVELHNSTSLCAMRFQQNDFSSFTHRAINFSIAYVKLRKNALELYMYVDISKTYLIQ